MIFFQLGWLGKKLKQIIEMKSTDIRGLLVHLSPHGDQSGCEGGAYYCFVLVVVVEGN